jgi:hypothetical protein
MEVGGLSNYVSKNTVVIIPAYEPPHALIDYVRDLLMRGIGGIVVVNDGSGSDYADIYNEISKIENCTVLDYGKNMGKGYALKYAFKYCFENYDDSYVFVTADCDGQHLSADVEKCARAACEHKGKLVLGSRDFSLEHVPKRSRSGNVFTRRMFKSLYGISLSDTQTGLRAFSYSLLETMMKIKGERFEYEMNMLIVLHKGRTEILEVPIETVYNGKSEDVEKVSHFRTLQDSARVMSTLFSNLGWYFLSSVISTAIELFAFYCLMRLSIHWHFELAALIALIPVVGARIISSVFNFTFNYKFVFQGRSKHSIYKYYILWLCQLAVSYGFTTLLTYLFRLTSWNNVSISLMTTICKGAFDFLLGIMSYQIQQRWVFNTRPKKQFDFYGPNLKIWRVIYTLFSKRYKSYVIPKEDEPAVYVCRHINMHAPIKVCQGLGFDIHMYVLYKFFTFKEAYKQYAGYTFTERRGAKGIKKFFGKIAAFFAALWVPGIVNSTESIPVYRGGVDAIKTYRKSLEYLDKGENIVLFPDINYTASENEKSDIYTGFLYIDKLYFRKYKKHLDFIIIKVDAKKREITETGRVCFADGVDFNDDMERVANDIHDLLMN